MLLDYQLIESLMLLLNKIFILLSVSYVFNMLLDYQFSDHIEY